MILLHRLAIKRLVEQGQVDHWTPALQGSRSLDCTPAEALADVESLFEIPPPATNVYHLVRRRYNGETVTRARVTGRLVEQAGRTVWLPDEPRPAVLQCLTYEEALAAGFRTRDDFYLHWRQRYLTGPRAATIPCWVTTYENVPSDPAYVLSTVIEQGRQGDYTTNPRQAADNLEAVDASEWAAQAERDRALHDAQARALWRAGRRRRRAA